MAWSPPPPKLPTGTVTDDTLQSSLHPSLHNAEQVAINQMIDEITAMRARLVALETTTEPPPVDPPPVDVNGVPTVSAVPTGYTQYWLEDFTTANGYLKANGGYFAPYVMQQSATDSYNTAANVFVDTSRNTLVLRTQAQTTNSRLYGSAYVGTNISNGGGNNANSYFPLEGYYEAMIKWPMAHSIWNSCWINYKGSATSAQGFEIDFAEMFTAQAPGRVRCQIHCPGQAAYGTNLLNSSKGTTTWHVPSRSLALGYGGSPGATHSGVDVDFNTPFPATGYADWHKVAVRTYKVTGTAGWTLGIDWYIDDVLVVSWVDPSNPNSAANPPWFDTNQPEQYSWDIRFDSWVGGDYIGRAVDSGGTNRIFTYDGYNGQNTTSYMRPVGEVPDAIIWKANSTADVKAEVAWVRVSTPTAPPPPPAPTYLFASNLSAHATGATLNTTGTDFYGRFPTSDSGTQTITVVGTPVTSAGQKSIAHEIISGQYSQAYWRPAATQTFPSLWARMYFRCAALPPGTPTNGQYILQMNPQAGGTAYAAVRLKSDGSIRTYVNVSGTLTASTTSATTIAINTWYCLEMSLINGNDVCTCRLRNASGTLLDEWSAAYNNAAEPGRVTFGIESTSTASWVLYTAYHAADDTDWIGPV